MGEFVKIAAEYAKSGFDFARSHVPTLSESLLLGEVASVDLTKNSRLRDRVRSHHDDLRSVGKTCSCKWNI